MYHLNGAKNFELVTSLAPSDMKAVDDLRQMGVLVNVIPSKHTVYFENKYGENQNNRKQRVLAKADPFTVEALKDIQAGVFHLGSLLADDFSLDVIQSLSQRGVVSVDSQGYLREVRGEKCMPLIGQTNSKRLNSLTCLK